MRRSLLRLWLGTGLLGSALALGCQHAQRPCPTCGGHAPLAKAPYANPELGSTTYPLVTNPPTTDYNLVPNPPAVAAAAPDPPVVPAAHATQTPARVEWLGATGLRPGTVGRRTFTDITAHPAFAHAPDYSYLVGALEYSRERGSWGLRYASVEEDDRYGGRVNLLEPGPTAALRPGQLVRVEGELIDSPAPEAGPAYRVRSLRPLQQP